jgi:hypothetical protein
MKDVGRAPARQLAFGHAVDAAVGDNTSPASVRSIPLAD